MQQRRVSPALVVALLALFVALGGTAYAAVNLPRNSVTTIQVKDRSLLGKDFKAGQIPRGPRGASGATNVIVRRASRTVAAFGREVVTAECQGTEKVTGGGYSYLSGKPEYLVSRPAIPVNSDVPTGWQVDALAGSAGPMVDLTAYAVCVSP